MSRVRGKDTKPEMIIRSGLHRRGFRFRLHDKRLPGKPDLVFRGRNAVVFVHGCFWHGHDCHLFKWPATRKEWWRNKIEGNQARDRKVAAELEQTGWRLAEVWECALKGRQKRSIDDVISELAIWLSGEDCKLVIRGKAA